MALTEGMRCGKCGSMNVSLDFDTNKICCNDCKAVDKPKRFDLEQYKLTNISEEENNINKLKIKGNEINIKTKLPDINKLNEKLGIDDNNYSSMGL